MPLDAEDYVHRVGRTARAGAKGKAISLACEDYVEGLQAIEKLIGFKLPHEFPDDSMLVRDIRHAPRHHREDGDRRRGGPGDRRGRRGAPVHAPSHAPPRPAAGGRTHARAKPVTSDAAPATGGDAAKKRRRRRRRRPGAPAPAPTS